MDVDTLQDNVEHITFADIVEDDLRHFTDANFIQLFRMCQLIIEYLLNVQNYLVGVSGQRNSQVEKFLLELQKHKAINQKKDERIKLLKHEVKSLKRELRAYERTAGRKATIVEASEKTGKFSCVMCRSHFYKEKYLAKHYAKRHPDYNSSTGAAEPKQALVSQSVVMEKIMSTLKTENNTQFELLTARLGDLERTLSEKDDLLRQQTMMLERGNEEKEGRKVHPIVTQLYDADEEAKYNVNRDDRDAKLKQELQEQQSQMFNDLTQYVSRLESELREIKETKIVQTVEIEEEEEEQEEEEEGEEESWHARTESTLSLAEQDRVRKELANHPYAYVPFPELPFLKSRYQHAHESIKSSFNSFQVISEKMEKKGYNALSHDLVHSGYAPSIAKVEQDIAFLMDKYYEVWYVYVHTLSHIQL